MLPPVANSSQAARIANRPIPTAHQSSVPNGLPPVVPAARVPSRLPRVIDVSLIVFP
ncbi:hypothetical protein DRA46_06870 [Burkholderia gladioli]|nr:hypothetical protein [Burkholderia gladioli]